MPDRFLPGSFGSSFCPTQRRNLDNNAHPAISTIATLAFISYAAGTKEPAYKAKNPLATVPCIDDEGFILAESHAILAYRGDKYGWSTLYPNEPQTRARIHQYMNWHHRNVREITVSGDVKGFCQHGADSRVGRSWPWLLCFSFLPSFLPSLLPILYHSHPPPPQLGLFAPAMRPDLGISPDAIKSAKALTTKALGVLEGWLGAAPYIAGTAEPTVADLSAYCEVSQLELFGLMNIDAYPNTRAWIQRCAGIKGHDAAHQMVMQMKDKIAKRIAKQAAKAKAKARL